jgi:hypothetical protein
MKKIVYYTLRVFSLILALPALIIGIPAYGLMIAADYIHDPYNFDEDV